MMKYFFSRNIVASVVTLLSISACSIGYTGNQNSFIERIVKERKLANGKVLMVGQRFPESSASCSEVAVQNVDHLTVSLKSNINLGGELGVLSDTAVSYVNEHPNDGINYAYLLLPNEIGTPSFQLPTGDTMIRYYACKHPPAKHNNPFKS